MKGIDEASGSIKKQVASITPSISQQVSSSVAAVLSKDFEAAGKQIVAETNKAFKQAEAAAQELKGVYRNAIKDASDRADGTGSGLFSSFSLVGAWVYSQWWCVVGFSADGNRKAGLSIMAEKIARSIRL